MVEAAQNQSEAPFTGAVRTLEHDLNEGLEVWGCACSAYADYFSAIARSRGLDDILNAQAKLLADGVDVFGRAAGAMQRRGGLSAPTLNEP